MALRIDGRYEVSSELGHGGMGEVYRVLDTATGEPLALKRMHSPDSSVTQPERGAIHFRREFHTLARLAHPNVVEVRDFGLDDGRPYYTMELLGGRDLRDAARASVRQCCGWLRDVASALALLHARGLLHRDLKSRNVRLTSDGRAKLIDFGVLATMGVAGDVAGTPSSIAPECVRGLPLDGRADLFGLGALAYWLLTGHHAYPARNLEEAAAAWAQRPVAPSQLREDIPEPLEQLVMSMLSVDPGARPRTAAETIDRLSVLAELEPTPGVDLSLGWLASVELVGREAELQRVRALATDTVGGRGDVLVFEAPSGAGKTRLLREAGVEAQLAGAAVLRATGLRGAGYDVVRQLVAGVAEGARGATSAAVSSALRRLLPELGASAGGPAGDPMEERLRVQRGLTRWFRALAEHKPLVLLIDELQRVDEPSLAALAALARESSGRWRIGMVAARATDDAVGAAAAHDALVARAEVVMLRGLDRSGVRALVHSLFGDVPHADAVAAWMHGVAGGSPLLCTELAHHLVDGGTIRYAEGTWLLPADLEDTAAPRALEEAMDQRVIALSAETRALGEALAVLGTNASLELLAAVAAAEESRTFTAIDELVERELLVGRDTGFEFRHEGLRAALLRGLDPEHRRELHRRSAEAMESTRAMPWSAGDEAGIGWHWLRGGDRSRGAEILERAGRRQYAAQSFVEAIPALEAALEVCEQREGPSRRCLELRQMLMRAGVVSDRSVVMRYADDTIAALGHQSGLATAAKLSRWLGNRIALVVALGWAWLGFKLGGSRRFAPLDALARVIALVNYTASVHSLGYATDEVRALLRTAAPLQGLRGRIPWAAYLVVENFLLIAQGKWERLQDNVTSVLRVLEDDDRTPLPEIDRRFARGAVHYMQASRRALDQDPAFERDVAALEELDLRFFDAAAFTARYMFHELRGERARAEANAERSRIYAVQLGNTWVFDSQRAWVGAIACSTARDVVGLKRAGDELERMQAQGFRFAGFAAFARAEYLRECGDPRGALAVLEPAEREAPPDQLFLRQLVVGARADAHLGDDDAESALRAADEGLAMQLDGEPGLFTARLRLRLTRARARAALGEASGAAAELEALAADAQHLGSPVWRASIDEARADLAAAAGRAVESRAHRADAAAWLRATANPVLVARAERLALADLPSASSGGRDEEEVATLLLRSDVDENSSTAG